MYFTCKVTSHLTGKINRNYPVTRDVTDQGAQLVISVGAQGYD